MDLNQTTNEEHVSTANTQTGLEVSTDATSDVDASTSEKKPCEAHVIPTKPENETERREFNLQRLADEITSLTASADDKIIELAMRVREAHSYFEDNASGDLTWAEWVRHNLPFKVSRANWYRKIADASDPKVELRRLWEMAAVRSAKHRSRTEQPLRDGHHEDDDRLEDDPPRAEEVAEVECQSKQPEPEEEERQFLREWLNIAPIEDLKKVISFLKSLGTGIDEYERLTGKGVDAYESAEAERGNTRRENFGRRAKEPKEDIFQMMEANGSANTHSTTGGVQ